MPHRNRAAIMVAAGLSVVAAPIPALGQITGDPTSRLGRPPPPLPRFEEPRRDFSPPPSPWSSPSPWSGAPTSRPGPWSSGGITQRQAMDILDAAGFTRIDPPVPNSDGSWTASAISRGERVRATVDLQGNISIRNDYR